MKKHLVIIFLALCILLGACAQKTASSTVSEGLSVYCVLGPDYQTDSALVTSELISLDGGDPVQRAAQALGETPQSEKLVCPLPAGVKIVSAVQNGNLVTVDMNTAYLTQQAIDKTLINACVTLTLCSIEDIDYVSIVVGANTVEKKLTADDFMLFNAVTSPQKMRTRLYFPKTGGETLCAEYRAITVDGDNSAERCILDALLQGPNNPRLSDIFPEGTIVLSVYTKDGVCSVSLSGLALDAVMPENSGKWAVYAIVDSLTTLPVIKSVQILLDGKPAQTLWGFDISKPLTRNTDIIGSAVD